MTFVPPGSGVVNVKEQDPLEYPGSYCGKTQLYAVGMIRYNTQHSNLKVMMVTG